jgi:hypothetical protein
MELFASGSSDTSKIGYINRNDQMCTGHQGTLGTDHG